MILGIRLTTVQLFLITMCLHRVHIWYQTYKVHIQENWDHRYFTAKFLGFDEEDTYIVKFENNKPCTIFDFREIYKVNEQWKEKEKMNGIEDQKKKLY